MTYKVIADPARHGSKFFYHVEGWVTPLGGLSHEPLLDACRELKRMGADPASQITLCHTKTRDQWALRTTVGMGAGLTVADRPVGGGVKFVQYKPYGGPK